MWALRLSELFILGCLRGALGAAEPLKQSPGGHTEKVSWIRVMTHTDAQKLKSEKHGDTFQAIQASTTLHNSKRGTCGNRYGRSAWWPLWSCKLGLQVCEAVTDELTHTRIGINRGCSIGQCRGACASAG